MGGGPAGGRAIRLTTYDQLDLYLSKFAASDLGLVLLLGRPGVGKSEAVRRWLGAGPTDTGATDAAEGEAASGVLYIEGHVQPFGLYRGLWEHRDQPVVLDDVDKLYADPNCVRLLKPLCNTVAEKRLTWLSRATADGGDVPAAFVTRSRLVLLANEWRTLNANVRALEDRAIVLHFDPPNAEVHRQMGRWFADPKVYAFVERVLPAAGPVSMRHYCKASQLRRAGLPHWRRDLLQMLLGDPHLACVAAVQVEPGLASERERVDHFVAQTGASRATYFRAKARLAGLSP